MVLKIREILAQLLGPKSPASVTISSLLYLLLSVVILYSVDAYSVPQVYLADKKRNLILSICCTKVLLFLFLDTWDTIRDHYFLLLPSFVLI